MNVYNLISEVSDQEFKFKPVIHVDVVNAISHFLSLTRSKDGIPQSVIVNALPVIENFQVNFINASWVFVPPVWGRTQLIDIKGTVIVFSVRNFADCITELYLQSTGKNNGRKMGINSKMETLFLLFISVRHLIHFCYQS